MARKFTTSSSRISAGELCKESWLCHQHLSWLLALLLCFPWLGVGRLGLGMHGKPAGTPGSFLPGAGPLDSASPPGRVCFLSPCSVLQCEGTETAGVPSRTLLKHFAGVMDTQIGQAATCLLCLWGEPHTLVGTCLPASPWAGHEPIQIGS